MRETLFFKKNKERWLLIEEFLKKPHNNDPDKLANLFIGLTDDLAYAQTHFSESKTTKYINNLSLKVHQAIYLQAKSKRKSPFLFFKTTLPLLIYKNRRFLLYSFIIFFFSAMFGIMTSLEDDSFVRVILGDSYVNMTEKNIDNNNPLAVYESMEPVEMFFSIAWNNIKVSFLAFAAGASLGVGTVFLLFRNGIMVGVFQYFFFAKGLLLESSQGIWLHGTVEIFSIIVAGAAGLILANSILFPKTYTRSQSIRKGATDGAKLVLGLIPFFVFAAFIESFITRHSSYSTTLDFIIISSSIILITWYFIIYPIIVNKKTKSYGHQKIKP